MPVFVWQADNVIVPASCTIKFYARIAWAYSKTDPNALSDRMIARVSARM
jgi:hypothetical protein